LTSCRYAAKPTKKVYSLSDVRYCKGCQTERPLSEFRKRGASAGKREGQPYGKCFDCTRVQAYSDRFNTEDPGPYLVQLTGVRRRNQKHMFSIDSSYVVNLWFKQKGLCALSGRKMTHIRGNGRVKTNASLDRIDSKRPYEPGNVQLVCAVTNFMKHDMTVKEMKDWCAAVLAYQDDQKRFSIYSVFNRWRQRWQRKDA